ncbi:MULTISPECIES: LysR family transcriptional regulator [Alkalimonas]|uniref:DNA-binding transcriptional regulator, LysR family n=3 Tax=Alkalimonas TaxID=265980 RepID=A0A1H4G3K1_ALKAM|nr:MULTISPECIES: LysR family transcriptional regulator [Alkalimonas]MCC5827649.1 LysR family transcriptional regulator [Alkalimonas sp.]MEE2022623.1 LysR family transcriptional regulator [Alkalimonas sp. MEB004]SEB04183.1 DNA-binding transcriptional regulator, LysR family [Alkalimonas amylolytica]
MKVIQAEVFLVVLEEGSVAAAARQLGRSRTTISSVLSSFEDELAVTLFERSGNELAATPIAWAIKPDCIRLLQSARQIEQRCQQQRSGIESTLRIARDDALPERFWRETMTALKQQFPLTGISVYLAPPQELPELVDWQSVDLAFGLAQQNEPHESLQFRPLGGLRVMMVTGPEHALCRLPLVHDDDLQQYTQVTTAYLQDDLLVPQLSGASNYLALTQFELIRDAVISGAGWSRLPQPVIMEQLKNEQLRVLKHPGALNWQSYQLICEQGYAMGRVASWLEQQVVRYLTQFG